MNQNNKTLTIIKPVAIKRGFLGPILTHIEQAGFKVTALKMVHLSRYQAEGFYEIHKEQPFFNDLVEFMSSGPIVVAILEKENAVADYRKLIGATNPEKAEEGTLRKLFGTNLRANAVHGSDSNENAEKECNYFFSEIERFQPGVYSSKDLSL